MAAIRSGGNALGFSIEVDGHVQTIHMFEGFDRDVRNFKPYFREVSVELRKYFRRAFAREGVGPRDGPWQGLSERYEKYKKRVRPGRKILQFDGTMRRALVSRSAPFGMRHITRDQMVQGTIGLPYPGVHQRGGVNVPIPQRMIIDLDSVFHRALRTRLIWHARKSAMRQRRRHMKKLV